MGIMASIITEINPECRSGKHTNCDGVGWDSEADTDTACRCACHQVKHVGGNAEDCRACDSSNPPYPFVCPGEGDAA